MSKSRLEAFSDGVFAIVITLLVLDLRRPVEGRSIASTLASEKYAFAAYGVAFLGIGVLWINHHAVLRHAARLDRAVTFANLVLLAFISLTPYTASLYADGLERGGWDAKVGAAFFSAAFVGVAVMFPVLWLLVTRENTLADGLDRVAARKQIGRYGFGVVPYAVLVAISFLSPLVVLVIHGVLGLYYAFDQLDASRFTLSGERS